MAIRRITSACLTQSTRRANAFLSTPSIHFRPNSIPQARHFQITSIRLEQQANTSAKRDPAPKIIRGQSKVFKDADAAVKDLKSGAVILSAGFGLCGTAGKFPQLNPPHKSWYLMLIGHSFGRNYHSSNRAERKRWPQQSYCSVQQRRSCRRRRPLAARCIRTN